MKLDRIDEYETYLNKFKNPFDILIFTETWLTLDKFDQCQFKGFIPIHLIRPSEDRPEFKTSGGGISIFVKPNIEFKQRNDLTVMLPFMESSFIEIKFNRQNYLIGGIYRVPDTNITEFIDHFNNIIEPIRTTHKVILLGDYNIDLFKNDNNKHNFEICLQSNYLIPTILSATRVASKIRNGQQVTSATLIDNIFINHDINYKSGVIESSITDHFSIYITIPEIKKPTLEPVIRKYRLINESQMRTFHCYLNYFGIWETLEDYKAESAYIKFLNIFQSSYKKSFPIKIKTFTEKKQQKNPG